MPGPTVTCCTGAASPDTGTRNLNLASNANPRAQNYEIRATALTEPSGAKAMQNGGSARG